MNKIVIGLVFLIFFSFFQNISHAKPTKKAKEITKHKIEFTTNDAYILVGDLYVSKNKSPKPLVVLVHSFGLNSQGWKSLAEKLRMKEYNVLAMDLRGHARSIYNEQLKLKSRLYFDEKDWARLPKDIIESIKYIRLNYPNINTKEVILVGADIGANASVIAAAGGANKVHKMVLISPMIEFKGLRIPFKTAKLYNTNILMLLSKTDRLLFNFYTKTPPIIKTYAKGGPGMQLLKLNPEANEEIIKFIIN